MTYPLAFRKKVFEIKAKEEKSGEPRSEDNSELENEISLSTEPPSEDKPSEPENNIKTTEVDEEK